MEHGFLNYSNIEVLEDHKELINNLFDFMKIIDKEIEETSFVKAESFEGSCHLFITSIIEYSKEAYNSIINGNFYALATLDRVIIENYVCLSLIKKYKDEELWKYWQLYSFQSQLRKLEDKTKQGMVNALLVNYSKDLGIEESVLNNKKFRKSNGWVESVCNPTMFDMCNQISDKIYADYKYLCDYSHGTSIMLKIITFSFYERFENLVNIFFIYVSRIFNEFDILQSNEEYQIVCNKIYKNFANKKYKVL